MARTNCKEAAELNHAAPARVAAGIRRRAMTPTAPVQVQPKKVTRVHESFTIIYSSASRHDAAHGGRAACGLGRVHATAGLGTARSRLSHHSSRDVLSGSRSR